jgi:cobalt-zinc-cadmium efflux system membrane fusion protein
MHVFVKPILPVLAAGLFASIAWAAPGAHGPNGEHLDGPTSTNATGLARLPDGSVALPKPAQRRLGIRTMVGVEDEHPLSLQLNGRVAIDPNAGGRVQAPTGGVVEAGPKGLPVAGQTVARGQVLAFIRHHLEPSDRAAQQSTRAELRSNVVLLEKKLARLEALEGTVPGKEIEAARIELASMRERERAVAGGLNAREPVRAPVAGIIASANLLAGQVVEPRDVLFDIVDPQRMVVEASTTDADMPARIGDASLASFPNVKLRFVGAARALRDGALPLTFRAVAQNTALAVGQPVTVVVRLKDMVKGIALPAQAVVRNPSNEPVVWIKSGAERFIAQPVEVRPLDAQIVVVTKGLATDNRVVVSGAALVNQIR